MDSVNIAFLVTELLSIVLCVGSNAVILTAILKQRALRNKMSYQFIIILSLANIASGMITVPLDIIISFLNIHLNFESCIVFQSVTVVFNNISLLVVVSGTVEISIAIRCPLFYRTYSNVRNARLVGCFAFLISLLVSMAPTTGWNKGRHNYEVTLNYTCSYPFIMEESYLIMSSVVLRFIPMITWLAVFSFNVHYLKRTSQSNTFKKDWSDDCFYAFIFMTIVVLRIPLDMIRFLYLYKNEVICYLIGQEVSSIKCQMPELYHITVILVNLQPFAYTVIVITKQEIRKAVYRLCCLSKKPTATGIKTSVQSNLAKIEDTLNINLGSLDDKAGISGYAEEFRSPVQSPERQKNKNLIFLEIECCIPIDSIVLQKEVPVTRRNSKSGSI